MKKASEIEDCDDCPLYKNDCLEVGSGVLVEPRSNHLVALGMAMRKSMRACMRDRLFSPETEMDAGRF